MFAGTDEELKQTKVTQPAVFLHSVIMAKALGVKPDAVAGHSLGEFSAWWWPAPFRSRTVCGSFPNVRWPCRKPAKPYPVRWRRSWDSTTQSGRSLRLDRRRGRSGQLQLPRSTGHLGQRRSGRCRLCQTQGSGRQTRTAPAVGGAFHSPLMEPAKVELEKAINEAPFQAPVCPIYQNVDAKPQTDPATIKANLIAQLTAPVRWTYIVKNMLADGVTNYGTRSRQCPAGSYQKSESRSGRRVEIERCNPPPKTK